ncbi:MAG: histidine phosphatase family protein [Lachnospiraceae bacterium]|nr:histidine phosphatase family protein [Lachnospiraceae bacterium]
MRILIIRHGDPDYTIDSLTEKGWREAEYLSERIVQEDIKEFYVSPLGRAKDTASFTLQKLNRQAIECEWLREFAPKINRPDRENSPICWDWLPQDWTVDESYYDYRTWYSTDIMKAGHVQEEYEWVTSSFDKLLAQHGYIRDGHFYRVEKANNDTIAFFCHFGLGCVLIGHLLGISPMILWHGLCAAPTSVTTITTEERRRGIASFRMSAYGDTSHLYIKKEPPAFAARFCESYDNIGERHD